MEKLNNSLDTLINKLSSMDNNNLRDNLEDMKDSYPFNKYEYIISNLLGKNVITLEKYLEIRGEYLARNIHLYLFEISAPRTFGEKWAESNINILAPELGKPTKKIDPDYSGQYDLIYISPENFNIKIEVKASRAVDFKSDKALYIKALSSDSDLTFDMNFQQIKPACCDVFLWVGVWRDSIKYWILSSDEVKENTYFSKGQHRGNVGEGQLHIKDENIAEFKKYEVKSSEILQKTIEAYKRQTNT